MTGFLAPEAGREEEEEATEELGAGNDETEEDTTGSARDPKKKSFLPASMGLSVLVPAGVTHMEATVRYATYDKVPEEPPRKDKARRIWKRVPMPPVTEKFALSELAGEGVAVSDSGGLRLQGQAQPIRGAKGVEDGTQAVSVFLVNYRAADNSPGYRDRGYVFQVAHLLRTRDGPDAHGHPDPHRLERRRRHLGRKAPWADSSNRGATFTATCAAHSTWPRSARTIPCAPAIVLAKTTIPSAISKAQHVTAVSTSRSRLANASTATSTARSSSRRSAYPRRWPSSGQLRELAGGGRRTPRPD